MLSTLKQKLLLSFALLAVGMIGSLFLFAPKALADKPGPNSPAWANAAECGGCGSGTWGDPGGFNVITNTKVITENRYNFEFDAIATESVGKVVFKAKEDGSYAVFENGAYGKPMFVKDVNQGNGYTPSWALTNDDRAQDNGKRPMGPGGKEFCSLKYDFAAKDCIDAPTGRVPSFTDEQWENIRTIVDNSNAANDTGKDCGDDSAINFITCPLFNMVNKTITKLIGGDGSGKGLLIDMFYVQPLSSAGKADGKNPLYDSWNNIKNVSLSFYVLVFIFIIFSNSMSLGIDAYTIKKTLPRIMAAALLSQFSYLLISILVDISNVIGIGLPSFLLAQGPQTFNLNVSGIWGNAAGIVSFLLIFILAIMALFSLIVTLITVVARQLVIFMLVLTAPIAFACWVLPNTQKLFQKWWSNLWRVLAMFPMATGIIAAAILFARTAASSGNAAGMSNLTSLAGAMAPLIALAVLPKTFKWGGDFVNFASGAAVGWAASKWGGGKDRAKAGMKSAAGSTRDRFSQSRLGKTGVGGVIGGAGIGSLVGSRKSIMKRGQQQARIYSDLDKAAAYADADQLQKLATSSNKGMQKAAIGRLAQTGNINGISTALKSGKVSEETYKQAVGQYFSNFDKMPQMRAVQFDNGQAQIDTVINRTTGKTENQARIDKDTLGRMSGSAIADMSAASRAHILNDHNIGNVSPAAIDQIRNNTNLSTKLNADEWQIINAHPNFQTQGTAPQGNAGPAPTINIPNIPPFSPGGTPPGSGSQPHSQNVGSPGQVWNVPPAPGHDDWTKDL